MRFVCASFLLLASCADAPAGDAPPRPATAGRGLTVVELFQSQGCSSCPPAIANVNAIADRPDILALTFAVTYWDRLGWTDSFGKPAFTARQWAYAQSGGRGQVFTPQVIVNGRTSIVGARSAQLDGAIAAAPPLAAAPALRRDGATLTVGAGATATPAAIWLIDYDPRALSVRIGAGENGGRTIVHRNVVTGLRKLGTWSGPALRLTLPPTPADRRGAVLVQQGEAGPILAALRI